MHKKGSGSSKNGHESNGKRPTIKKFDGQVGIPSNVTLRKTKFRLLGNASLEQRNPVASSAGKLAYLHKGASKKRRPAYLTKNLLIRLTSRAFQEASHEAMKVMGYIVVEHEGWIVRKFKDGSIEKIQKLEKSNVPLIFD
jgi:ribosomal protein L27